MDRLFAILLGWPTAFLILKYRRSLKEWVGDIGFAEKIFGAGGTNTFIVLLGVGLFIGCLMYALGTFQGFLQVTFGRFF